MPGMMKIIADSVPASDACVCTILFSRILESFAIFKMAIEMTAAGIAEEKVRPTLSPRYTLDAVKITVRTAPSSIPRTVSSGSLSSCRMNSLSSFFIAVTPHIKNWFSNCTPPTHNHKIHYVIILYLVNPFSMYTSITQRRSRLHKRLRLCIILREAGGRRCGPAASGNSPWPFHRSQTANHDARPRDLLQSSYTRPARHATERAP